MGKTRTKLVATGVIRVDEFCAWAAESGHAWEYLYLDDDGYVDCVVMANYEGRDAYWSWLCSNGDEFKI